MSDDIEATVPLLHKGNEKDRGTGKRERSRVALRILVAVAGLVVLGPFLHCHLTKVNGAVDWDRVSHELEALRTEWHVPGMAVGVVHNGQLVYSEGFGARNEQGDPVDADTLFEIGSTTKAFTSFAVGILVDEGKLDWETPVTSLYPMQFKDPVANASANLIDIMSHRTGLANHFFLTFTWRTDAELLDKIQHLDSFAPFRDQFHYNNNMFTLAGNIAGKASGLGWEQLVAERILKPLNMTRTFTDPLLLQNAENHARGFGSAGYVYGYNETFPVESSKPAGSMVSTVNDLAKWLTLINNNGTLPDGVTLISGKQFDTIVTPHITLPNNFPTGGLVRDISYGLGWMIKQYRDRTCIEHGGGTYGYRSQLTTFPQDSLAVIVLTNQADTPLPDVVVPLVTDRILFPRAWSLWNMFLKAITLLQNAAAQAARDQVIRTRHKNTQPTAALAEYTGIYRNPGYGNLVIRAFEKDKLVAELQGTDGWDSGLKNMVATHWEFDRFGMVEIQKFLYNDSAYPLLFLDFAILSEGESVFVESVAVPLEPALEPIVFERVI
ncbi:beta-lactamase/transpeptidase-like protein [Chytriomyces sp. MP71]|nr:beta-lactamase/transpeptidase-like protein [Chytriomyces sp. MP71]